MKRQLLLTALVLWIGNLQAQISKVNVTIDGPGVVDEYLSLDADGKKQLKLKAVPSKFLGNVSFDGWSGDATGTSEELIVSPDKAQNIHATFTYHRRTKQYPLLNLKQSWTDMGKPMYIEMPSLIECEPSYLWRGHDYLPVDYNRDGYMDYVQFPLKGPMGIDNHREKVRFWLGKPDGSFEEDPLNDNRMLGTVYSIHVKYADFNDDGYPDFCSFSSGYDRGGSTLDYPVILMSGPDGVYTDLRFDEYEYRYFHGGEVGDIDNDGDIDVLFLDANFESQFDNSVLLINDGKGNFTRKEIKDVIDLSEIRKRYSTDQYPGHGDLNIIDLNNDGYNDLAFPGEDVFDPDGSNYHCAAVVFWGNSSGTFGGSNYSLLPKCRLGYSINNDLVFYDLNGDGMKEIILERSGDGQLGETRFYKKGYLQVCEWENGEYVDKTDKYIPIENTAYNEEKSENCLWIENVDGTDYVCASWGEMYYSGVGVGQSPIYAIRNGILEPVKGYSTTKIPSYDEGMPIYVDGTLLTDTRHYGDGVNPVDTMAEHSWVDISDWDATGGNMWRINFAHRKNTHFGRTCIRWNRDGLDPNKEVEKQGVSFMFVSDVDISKLRAEGYSVELYIKNSDPDLTLKVNGVEIGAKDTDEGSFTGEWQRMSFPLNKMWDGPWSGLWIEVGKGDLNNEFFLDDIRIRRLADSGMDDYNRAFLMEYLNKSYFEKERTAQVQSQEFKAMLKPLISKFAPDSMNFFNKYITNNEVPLTRGLATCMAYYTARCIGAESNNAITGEQPADIWECDFNNFDDLLPHWGDPGEADAPDEMFWRGFGGWMTCFYWNFSHASDKSGINVIGLDKDANSFHWNDPLTWEDAIRAITRLYDSTDRKPVVVLGDANGDGLVNVTDIVATVNYIMEKPSDGFNKEAADLNGDGVVNVTDIVMMVKIIMEAAAREME